MRIPLCNEAVLLPRGKRLVGHGRRETRPTASTRAAHSGGLRLITIGRDHAEAVASEEPGLALASAAWRRRSGSAPARGRTRRSRSGSTRRSCRPRSGSPGTREHFDTVEVDSTYYRLPSESMVQGWAERTPDGFTMHIKAFGLMTRHPVKVEVVPEDLRAEMPVDERGRVDRPPRELRAEIFRRFLEALEPLRAAGKLGGILFQLPPYIVYKDIVARVPRVGAGAAGGLRDARRVPPPLVARRRAPRRIARLPRADRRRVRRRRRAAIGHGEEPRPDRRGDDVADWRTSASTAATSRPGTSAAARPPSGSTTSTPTRSSREWVEPLQELAGQAEQAYAFFNNNASSEDPDNPLGRVAQAATNARQLRRLLDVNRIAASGGT